MSRPAHRVWEIVDDVRRPLLWAVGVRRPDDLFAATFAFYNLRVVGSPPTLRRTDAARPAHVVLELPPQSFLEEALLDATGPEVTGPPAPPFPESSATTAPTNVARSTAEALPPLPSVRLRMAGPSRLAFTMPADVTAVPYTLVALLAACRTWPMRRASTAVPGPTLDLPGGVVDAEFVRTHAASPEFTEARAALVDTMGTLAGREAELALTAAARRIAERALALARESPARAAAALTRLADTEVDALVARFPTLGARGARGALSAALGYEAAAGFATLAPSGLTLADAVSALPFLKMVLRPHRPARDVTALELPYRLLLSPLAGARWAHRDAAIALGERHELWHTRLTLGTTIAGADVPSRVRAIWSDDYALPDADVVEAADGPRPFRASLDALDRRMLVQLTAGFDERRDGDTRGYLPFPASARRLVLSPLGGLLDAEGNWRARPDGVDLQQWRHLATLGRDHYVRVVYAGYLLPFGHAASLIKVTERKFEELDAARPRATRVAALRQRFFLVVRERVRVLDGAWHVHGGRNFPFTSVEVLTSATPNLIAPTDPACKVFEVPGAPIYGAQVARRMAFWPMLDAGASPPADFAFTLAATDWAGRRTTFTLPLLFVGETANDSAAVIAAVRAGYNAEPDAGRRTAALHGASVCWVPPTPGAKGDPRLPTHTARFAAGEPTAFDVARVNCYPECEQAVVGIPALQRILGRGGAVATVEYAPLYTRHGFRSGNPGELFLQIPQTHPALAIAFGGGPTQSKSDAIGALAAPAMAVRALSRLMGPAADASPDGVPTGVSAGQFRPAHFLAGAKILGGISLGAVLDDVTGLANDAVPKFHSRELPAGGEPTHLETRFEWNTTISQTRRDPVLPDLLVPGADGANPSRLLMRTVMRSPIGTSGAPTVETEGTLDNFTINLFGFVSLHFLQLRFTATQGRKPDVAVRLHPEVGVRFGGPLEFVNTLREIIPASGFADGPPLEVTPSGIAARYGLMLPSLQVGVFALSNLTFGAGFALPFDARPVTVTFNFAERQNPFSLTVSLLGGGGFLAIGVGADGVREIEAALEAGARLAIDLGVASGSVEVMAGIYFHWLDATSDTKGVVELSGYVRLHGELDVMGIISASLTFNLQLGYKKRGARSVVFGEATLVVEIDVLVFSGEVTVRCRREFGGSKADPTFPDLVSEPAWAAYCLAFAEE